MTSHESAKLRMFRLVGNFLDQNMVTLRYINLNLPFAFEKFEKACGEVHQLKVALNRKHLIDKKNDIRGNVTQKIVMLANIMKRIATEKGNLELAKLNFLKQHELTKKGEKDFAQICNDTLERCQLVRKELAEYNIKRDYLWDVDKRLGSFFYLMDNIENIMAPIKVAFSKKLAEVDVLLKAIDELMKEVKWKNPGLYKAYKFYRVIHKETLDLYLN